MNDNKALTITLLALFICIAFVISLGIIANVIRTNFPICQEDVVILGVGEFTASATHTRGGTWEFYICGPAVDDYDPSL